MNANSYAIVTERIISLLNQGVCPWRRPWSQLNISPHYFASGRGYQGINFLLLSALGFEVPVFMTYKQVEERKGRIRTGSKGFPVVYWSMYATGETDAEGKAKKVPMLRFYTVFNASQIEGIQFPEVPKRSGAEFMPSEAAESVVALWPDGPRILHGMARASYAVKEDEIQMPSRDSFDTPAEYYGTLFHEMAHATGAPKRLNRAFGKRYGDDLYSREELVAEMTSAFLCAHCGLDNDVIQNQAAYVANWIKALKADPKLVIVAASQAQKAANLILGIVPEDVTVQPAEATA